MKRIKQLGMLAILGLALLSTGHVEAKNPPNGVQNYIKDGHLFVWFNNHYEDMGAYNPCHGCAN